MANSLSIEETNVIREKLGLKLIPLVGQGNGTNIGKLTIVSSISIDETNKIRSQLGLQLIPIEIKQISTDELERINYLKKEQDDKSEASLSVLKRSLEEKKSQLKRRKQLAKGGLLDRDTATQSLEDWLSEIGNAKEDPNVTNGDKEASVKPLKKKLKFKSKTSTINTEDQKVLTLKDIDIMDDTANDNLVHNETEFEKKLRSDLEEKKLQTGEMVSNINRDNRLLGDNEENSNNLRRKLVSLKSLSSDEELSDNELQSNHVSRDISKPKFKKLKKGKKNSRTKPVDLDIDFKPVRLVNADNNNDDDDDEEHELDLILAVNRAEKLKQQVVKENIIEPPELVSNGEVIQENLYFLDNIKVESLHEVINSSKVETNQKEKITTETDPEISKRVSSILRDQSQDQDYSISSILSKLNSKDGESNKDDEIKIKYTDDEGNELSTKEAYKFMSRKFHGTGMNKKSKLS